MTKARVRIFWNASPSLDVVAQHIMVRVNENILTTEILPPTLEEFEIVINENDSVYVELIADDGTNQSDPARLSFKIPDLTKPQPPSGLFFEIMEVVVVDETPTPTPIPEPSEN